MVIEFGGLFEHAAEALWIVISQWQYLLLGILAGMILGVIPGMGGAVTLTVLLPFSIRLDPTSAFVLFGGALGATTFAGSLTAILVNTPGSGSNAATLLDGYPLTRQGEAKTAIGASAFSSATGAVLSLVFFLALIPFIIEIALLFGNSEVFWLVLIGLTVLPLVAGDRMLAGLAVGALGLIFAFTGPALRTGEMRFSHGFAFLFDGIGLVPAIVGLFAIAEMVKLASQNQDIIKEKHEIGGSIVKGVKETIRHRWLWFRCTLIGLLIGTIPGAGGSVANFVSYGHAVQTSKNPQEFGTGRIEGVIASEAANDSKDGGQLFPTLSLGIPGSGSMAVLLTGFLVHGIQPGPGMLSEELTLMLVIVFSLIASNVLTSVIGVIFSNQLVQIADLPIAVLSPSIIVLSLMAVFISRNHFPDLFVALFFGLLGIALMYFSVSRIPIILALVLGGIFENNFYISLQLAQGDWFQAFFVGTLNQILVVLLIVTILFPFYGQIRRALETRLPV
ncbi:tripartite tricarboxylate transporter permease [Halorubrum sp. DTA98]|uniref:tripartite tricarboxylate transporter permease n=1 Tax=Halorubrum sp. DTA98 TaxID=3402163 RepID=UPI003AAD7733